jgi:FkbM family methyltransferase
VDSNLRFLWNERSSGRITRDEYRLFASHNLRQLEALPEFIQRSGSRSLSFEKNHAVLTLEDGSRFSWDPKQIGSAPNLLLIEGSYERFETIVLLALSESASFFIDVGANIGYFAVRLAIHNSGLQAIAVEAIPSTVDHLRANVALNNLSDRVLVVNCAIGAAEGRTKLFVPRVSGHTAASIRDQHPDEGSDSVEVDLRLLDSLLSAINVKDNDLLKLDVEGAEFEVLKGASALLQRSRPTIFAELLRKWMRPFDAHPNDVIALLCGFGYRCLQFADEFLEEINVVTEETIPTNFLFVQPHKLDELSRLGFIRS